MLLWMRVEGISSIIKIQSSNGKMESIKNWDLEGEYDIREDTRHSPHHNSSFSLQPFPCTVIQWVRSARYDLRHPQSCSLCCTGVNSKLLQPRWMALHFILVYFELAKLWAAPPRRGIRAQPQYLGEEAFQDPSSSYNVNQSTEPKAGEC